jgi:cation diffusion facilitator CzcD-associated flavoprotein CzcO
LTEPGCITSAPGRGGPDRTTAPPEHLDVLVVGAGLSGIGAACHLRKRRPDHSFAILEARERLGGTWDLFRYPGVRSDSDMYTLAYGFRPWREPQAIVEGAAILRYLEETAREHGVDEAIRYGWRVVRADWATETALWTVQAVGRDGGRLTLTCSFLFLCGGYYSYRGGHDPEFPGRAAFGGRLVHPQAWPGDLDCRGKRVVVIGSGATAVTLVPALAEQGARVTMLQRSPSYIVSRPGVEAAARKLERRLPRRLAYALVRWRNLLLQQWIFRLARRRPQAFAGKVIGLARRQLPAEVDVATHFTPRYAPWDQRLCLARDGDFFGAIRSGAASVVTGEIERFTGGGVRLTSGEELPADVVVTATGLELEVFNGVALSVDGRAVEPGAALGYRGLMYEGVPNLATCFGYTNASWTLRSDLTALYVCRLLAHMRRTGLRQATPRNRDPNMPRRPWLDFTSGYVRRALDRLPKQGDRGPWRNHQSFFRDWLGLRLAPLSDGALAFTNPAPRAGRCGR